jgi:hypothetical protein
MVSYIANRLEKYTIQRYESFWFITIMKVIITEDSVTPLEYGKGGGRILDTV